MEEPVTLKPTTMAVEFRFSFTTPKLVNKNININLLCILRLLERCELAKDVWERLFTPKKIDY